MHLRDCVSFIAVVVFATFVSAETVEFGSGDDTFTLEFVNIGATGNPHDDDPRVRPPRGGVDYEYGISKFETICSGLDVALRGGAFPRLNTDRLCFQEQGPAITAANTTVEFINWLNTNSGFAPAYKSIFFPAVPWSPDEPGYNPSNPLRNSGARYFLPTADEWYKAAFYDPEKKVYYDFATGSDELPISVAGGTEPGTAVFCTFLEGSCTPGTLPGPMANVDDAGGLSPFGTMGQLGNGSEWEESQEYYWAGISTCAPIGGCIGATTGISAWENRHSTVTNSTNVGFRVVSIPVPEPIFGSATMGIVLAFQLFRRRRLARIERPRHYSVSFACLARSGRRHCSSCAATCGRLT